MKRTEALKHLTEDDLMRIGFVFSEHSRDAVTEVDLSDAAQVERAQETFGKGGPARRKVLKALSPEAMVELVALVELGRDMSFDERTWSAWKKDADDLYRRDRHENTINRLAPKGDTLWLWIRSGLRKLRTIKP